MQARSLLVLIAADELAQHPHFERKFNPMLLSLGIFSSLYGLRLFMQMSTFELMVPPWRYYKRLPTSINYLVPIPGFFYFYTAGFLGSRGRRVAIP